MRCQLAQSLPTLWVCRSGIPLGSPHFRGEVSILDGPNHIPDESISEEQRAVGWDQFLETIPNSLREWWLNYVCPATCHKPFN